MTSNCPSIFRKDKTNVGDWWSPPHKYFPLDISASIDLLNSETVPNEPGLYIVGGGGLGNSGFNSTQRREVLNAERCAPTKKGPVLGG